MLRLNFRYNKTMRCWCVFLVAVFASINLPLSAAVREDTRLESNWGFLLSDILDAEKPGVENAYWGILPLPHNWGWQQAQDGHFYMRGPGWYRHELNPGDPQPGRRYFLRFEAAASVADVFVNGHAVGQHRGAFGAFCFEVTPFLAAHGTNLLAVRVSNRPEPDLAPLSGDFPMYGGLYRPVHLLVTDEICFAPTNHASPGVTWLQTKVTAAQASVDVTAQISNPTGQKSPVTLLARILDAQGRETASSRQELLLPPDQTLPFSARLVVPKPHLWNGRKDPYLYRAVVELVSTNGPGDRVEQPLGLRYFSVDPDKGFFLNGKPYALHGVNRHQDRLDKGWAISEADQDEDMNLIKELGCTVVRCAHYQHSDYFYSLCDRAGILVWAEIPQVNEIGTVPEFAATSRGQLLDLIRQNINHPSIFAWSLFNELRPGKPDPNQLLHDLKSLANAEDPTRPTIAATCTTELPQMNKIPDLLGWNIYPGWYPGWGTVTDYGAKLDSYRNTSRAGGYCVSEYGAGANVNQHEQNPGQPRADGQWHPEEWQAIVHEEAWKQMKQRPWIWGTFVWNMFDFAVSTRHEGGVNGRNDKGLVTFDRQTKKDAFYFYQANWTEAPMVYLTSRRFTERTNSVTDVKIYSNAAQAELLLNGASQGTRKNDGNAVFIWKNIKLAPGENRVEARARSGGKTVTDSCVWNLKAP
jgi:beta-galactosidase